MKYQVICGNIGIVYNGDDQDEAYKRYNEYLDLSAAEFGRASGEEVIAFKNEEIWKPEPKKV